MHTTRIASRPLSDSTTNDNVFQVPGRFQYPSCVQIVSRSRTRSSQVFPVASCLFEGFLPPSCSSLLSCFRTIRELHLIPSVARLNSLLSILLPDLGRLWPPQCQLERSMSLEILHGFHNHSVGGIISRVPMLSSCFRSRGGAGQ